MEMVNTELTVPSAVDIVLTLQSVTVKLDGVQTSPGLYVRHIGSLQCAPVSMTIMNQL